MKRILLTVALTFLFISNSLFAQWSVVCGTGNGFVDNFEVFNGELYGTGFFTNLCGTPNNHIVKWDGSVWQPVGTGYSSAGHQLKYLGNFLYFVGYQPVATDSNWVYMHGGVDFGKVGDGVYLTNAANGTLKTANLYALEQYNGRIIASGEFNRVGNKDISGIMQWDGSAWDSLGSGLSGNIAGSSALMYPHDMCTFGNDLIVAGNFLKAGGITVNGIARWDGNQWHSMDGGFNNIVYSVCVYNGELYAGGEFTMSGSTALKCIAKWNGTSWVDPGFGINYSISGMHAFVHTMRVLNTKLYLAGGFDRVIDGTTVRRGQGVFGFNGTTVDTLSGGTINRELEALAWYDGDLYVGGGINNNNSYIAKYDGTASLKELEAEITWTIQPNPIENICTLSGSKKNQLISILTPEGKICQTILAQESEIFIDFSDLSSGVYFVKIGEQQRRVVKR